MQHVACAFIIIVGHRGVLRDEECAAGPQTVLDVVDFAGGGLRAGIIGQQGAYARDAIRAGVIVPALGKIDGVAQLDRLLHHLDRGHTLAGKHLLDRGVLQHAEPVVGGESHPRC